MLTLLASLVVLQTPSDPPPSRQVERRVDRASVTVDGKRVRGRVLVRDDRVQLPMRAIFERLGANVMWYPENRKVVALTRGKTITLVLGENVAYDPRPVVLDYPPRIVGGRIYVPLRFVAESFGARVSYDRKTRTARVMTSPTDR